VSASGPARAVGKTATGKIDARRGDLEAMVAALDARGWRMTKCSWTDRKSGEVSFSIVAKPKEAKA
jgi:hypothetical protein